MIARQQEEEIETKRMATEWARRLNSKETVQTPEFLDRCFHKALQCLLLYSLR